jgi:hypothetical protein
MITGAGQAARKSSSAMYPNGIIHIQHSRPAGEWLERNEGAQHLTLQQRHIVPVRTPDCRQVFGDVPQAPSRPPPKSAFWGI